MESNTKIQMEQLRKFTETAKYTSEKQKEAILKLILLTGLADEIEEVDMKVNGERQTRSNVLLPELKGKTKEEINEYLDKHNVYEVFSSLKDKGISNDELDRIIVGFTQKCWFARDKNGERIYGTPPESLTKFDDYESTTGKKGVVRLTLEELNIFNSERKETKITDEEIKNTTTVALLGANVRGMEERIKYLLSTGLKDYQLFFLVGQRNLLKTEREIDGLLENVQEASKRSGIKIPQSLDEITETDLAYFLYDKYKKEFEEKGVKVCTILDASATLNHEGHVVKRPNTEATVRCFLEQSNVDLEKVIYISNGINVNPQKIAIENVYHEKGIDIPVVVKGSAVSEQSKFSQLSGALAGVFYGVYDRNYENDNMDIVPEKTISKRDKLAYNKQKKQENKEMQEKCGIQQVQSVAPQNLTPMKRLNHVDLLANNRKKVKTNDRNI